MHDHGDDHHSHDHAHGAHEHGHHHAHSHGHAHDHNHDHDHRAPRMLKLEEDLLAKNRQLAERNRGWLAGRRILALNLVSSPGAGKTTLLERTIADQGRDLGITVIEGDQATEHDARRIEAAGARALQINTGAGCHLDARMIGTALERLDPAPESTLLIENVGNLVCPALFDLGERAKVVIMSVTEGDDKPIKYPHMFRASSLMILNKLDLLPYVRFDVARCIAYAREVNPSLEVLQLSATRGDGLDGWYHWLHDAQIQTRARRGIA
jgi:hydrogenase nickel incorporation protein HypB